MSGIQVVAAGSALPRKCVSNKKFEATLDTSDEWIRTRTGILERRFCGEEEDAASLGEEAAEKALARAEKRIPDIRERVGLIITATSTSPLSMPSVSCLVQERLGLKGGIPAFDVGAACSGYVYAIVTALSLMDAMNIEFALVIGTEQMSRILDFKDRSTCVLFGDGAGAAIITRNRREKLIADLGSEGNRSVLEAAPSLRMDGRAVFRFAVTKLTEELNILSKESGISICDIDRIVCHQANVRIIDFVREKLGLPREKFFINLPRLGNTCAASIPLALADLEEAENLAPESHIFLVGFGAGLTWGGVMVTFL